MPTFVRCLAAIFACGAMLLAAGCDQRGTAPVATPIPTQPKPERIGAAAEKSPESHRAPTPATYGPAAEPPASSYPLPPAAAGELKEETWDAYSMAGQRVGYACNRIAEVMENGRMLVRTSSDSVLVMQRLGQSITQRLSLASWETAAGELVRFETEMSAGGGEVRTRGEVRDGRLTIETATLGKSQTQSIAWESDWGGFFAADQSLRNQPLQPGEKRTIYGLLPIFNVPGHTVLVAGDYETVQLPAGERRLLKVNSRVEIGQQAIDSQLWVDEQGETLKSLVPGIEQVAYRTTRADALLNRSGRELDLMLASIVPLSKPLANPLATQRVVYRAKIKSGSLEGTFASGLSQQVKLLGEREAEIAVRAVRPDEPAELPAQVPGPTAADTAPNNMIQSDDPAIVQMAAQVSPGEKDPWRLACALEKYVAETIRAKNFSQAFATASEVAASREGDCTEHAVLLAALCRAREIPARVAFGLVYYPPQQGFAYHMWNEVWTGDRWVPLDGTLGQGGIGADHMKLADSDLKDTSALATMLPVVQLMGQLELTVVEAE